MQNIFTNKNYIYLQSKKKKIIQFGASEIARKTRKLFKDIKFEYILDNSSNLWNQKEGGLNIYSPEILKNKKNKEVFIVITSTSYHEISLQLEGLGFKKYKDFVVTPILNDLISITNLESIKAKVIFSSGSPPLNDPCKGGGIYELNITKEKYSIKKKISGNCYGITKYNDNFIAIDNQRGIIEFDNSYRIKRKKNLPKNIRPHGVAYSEKQKLFFIVCSNSDQILVLDNKFNFKKYIYLSSKSKKEKKPIHHANDCCFVDGNLYVSMFSETGNWINDIFDGAICEFDPISGKKNGTPVKNLWMPHNISNFYNDFYVLDSLKGNLLGNNMNQIASFNGFVRGLDLYDNYFFIGQSKNRNFSKIIGASKNNSIDCGIIILDTEKKISRFFQFPPSISEIHSVKVIDCKV